MSAQSDLFAPHKHLDFRTEIAAWTADEREELAERCAIMEFDGLMSRDEAELAAYRLIRARRDIKGAGK